MKPIALEPDRIELAPGLQVPRLITGLWQVADMERGGQALPLDRAAQDLADYARAGFDAFDMADHYGSAELIAGRFLRDWRGQRPAHAFTKWCPEPQLMSAERVRAGVDERRSRLGVERLDLLQFHWWDYTHPGYIDGIEQLMRLQEQGQIRHLGLTNFDTDHLRLLRRHGAPIVTNQVSLSLLDRRATGRMSALCQAEGIRLLAYGTLAGGFLSERWLGQQEPDSVADWSKSKYQRFIDAIGGWAAFQGVLQAAHTIGRKHGVSIAAVSLRWVLEQPAVGAVIVGARLGESEHRASNMAVFGFALDAQDHAELARSQLLEQFLPTRQITDLPLQAGIDATQQSPLHVFTAGQQSLGRHKRSCANHRRVAAQGLQRAAQVLDRAAIGRLNLDVRDHAEHAVAHFFLKAVHHAEHDDERGHTQGNAQHGHGRNERNEAIAPGCAPRPGIAPAQHQLIRNRHADIVAPGLMGAGPPDSGQ